MKISEIEAISLEDLTAQLEAKGISPRKLSGATVSSELPEGKVTFTEYSVVNTTIDDKESAFIVVHTDKGDKCTLSRLQAAIFKGTTEEAQKAIVATKKGDNYYLPTPEIVNPKLQGNQAAALKMLVGKTFNCKKVEGLRSTYKAEGYDSIEEVEIKPYITYALEAK